MNWLMHAVVAALALAAADVCVKLASGKVPNSLGMLLYGSVAFATGLTWYAIERWRGIAQVVDRVGILYALAVGVMFTTVTFAMYAAFRNGAPISLASPLIRLGGLVVASAVGLFLWKEPANARYIIGLALSCAGIGLMMSR